MEEVISHCINCGAAICNHKLKYCNPECRKVHENQRINQNWIDGKICNQKRPAKYSGYYINNNYSQ